jgi:polysaccharide pyruvyl transferase WcaK-like protein
MVYNIGLISYQNNNNPNFGDTLFNMVLQKWLPHYNIINLHHFNFYEKIKQNINSIFKNDNDGIEYIFFGGGDLFSFHTNIIKGYDYCDNILIKNKKIIICSVGVDSNNKTNITNANDYNHLKVINFFKNDIEYISVRDMNTKKILNSYTNKKINMHPDMVYSITNKVIKKSNHKYTVGVCYRYYKDTNYNNLIKLIDYLILKGIKVIIFFTEKNEDKHVPPDIQKYIIKDSICTFSNYLTIFNKCNIILGMRFHACVIAHTLKIPYIGIGLPEQYKFMSLPINIWIESDDFLNEVSKYCLDNNKSITETYFINYDDIIQNSILSLEKSLSCILKNPREHKIVTIFGGSSDKGQRSFRLKEEFINRGYYVLYIHMDNKDKYKNNLYNTIVSIDTKFNDRINNLLLLSDIYIFEVPNKKYIKYLEQGKKNNIKMIYECIDYWKDPLLGLWWFYNVKDELYFTEKCDIVTVTSKKLGKHLKSLNSSIKYHHIHNACDNNIFNFNKKYNYPDDLTNNNIEKFKYVLYYGHMPGYFGWFDWNIMNKICKEMYNINFVLIGKVSNKIFLPRNKNCIYLGYKNIEELPSYLYYCKIAICPFKNNKLLHTISPIKIFEYMQFKKQIITIKNNELIKYKNILHEYKNYEEFKILINKLFYNNKLFDDYDPSSLDITWKNKVEYILDII